MVGVGVWWIGCEEGGEFGREGCEKLGGKGRRVVGIVQVGDVDAEGGGEGFEVGEEGVEGGGRRKRRSDGVTG